MKAPDPEKHARLQQAARTAEKQRVATKGQARAKGHEGMECKDAKLSKYTSSRDLFSIAQSYPAVRWREEGCSFQRP